ncbi:hypothetical protein M409DRAFT_56223 [Zasmidium cellare ATCC 36951]|uniref:Uncharacterized protein n=1 Tax=Zasmidium cellare ATCC 36951 TaxID=1080233 RepID=A0A6A6CDQ8_ZASCE|nr:uncharacterized protein M409DRAFT_56223 [Zasmidium cellare ATCC 36951]KAF2164853.1 hypothetical protein M409DRAFT_56223 [Zasmidium cellare ATCC 36951]
MQFRRGWQVPSAVTQANAAAVQTACVARVALEGRSRARQKGPGRTPAIVAPRLRRPTPFPIISRLSSSCLQVQAWAPWSAVVRAQGYVSLRLPFCGVARFIFVSVDAIRWRATANHSKKHSDIWSPAGVRDASFAARHTGSSNEGLRMAGRDAIVWEACVRGAFAMARICISSFALTKISTIPQISAMASSKFVEILDTSDTPYSRANVSLDDVLAETRNRSQSQTSLTSSSASDKSSSPTTSSPTSTFYGQPTQQIKTRLRGFSMKKNKT